MKNLASAAKLLGIFSIALFSWSCDPGVKYEQVIENASDHDLTLIIFPDTINPFLNYEFDTFNILRQSEVVLALEEGLGTTDGFKGCLVPLDSAHFIVGDNDLLKVKTDITNSDFWRFRVLDKDVAGGGECECRLIITNDSIQ